MHTVFTSCAGLLILCHRKAAVTVWPLPKMLIVSTVLEIPLRIDSPP